MNKSPAKHSKYGSAILGFCVFLRGCRMRLGGSARVRGVGRDGGSMGHKMARRGWVELVLCVAWVASRMTSLKLGVVEFFFLPTESQRNNLSPSNSSLAESTVNASNLPSNMVETRSTLCSSSTADTSLVTNALR